MNRIRLGAAFLLLFLLPLDVPALSAPPVTQSTASAPSFTLPLTGSEFPVNYRRYGKFIDLGTTQYRYEVTDPTGLGLAVGAGIYPNYDLSANERFKQFKAAHPDSLSPWDFLTGNPEEAFYVWTMAEGIDDGVKLFFIGESLRRAGHVKAAIRAYYAVVVHFPRAVAWNEAGNFYWYVAPEAISRIRRLCAENPRLGIQLESALVDVTRAADNDPSKDTVKVWPGDFRKNRSNHKGLSRLKIIETRGRGRVKVVKFQNGHWQLRVDGAPLMVRGVTYTNTKIGESPHDGSMRPWMAVDDNGNGLNDGMFDSWVDINRNNRRDPDEAVVGDARLLREAGVNAIRVYHGQRPGGAYDPSGYDKDLMRRLNREFGIYFVMGDFFGAYAVGSGATWERGTDYTDPAQRQKMRQSVEAMVRDHKDEPYVLMWLLGNENQHPHTRTNADREPAVYAKFVNEVAAMIHGMDPEHPVAVANLGANGLKELARYAPEVDIYGANAYAGEYSMGSIVQQVKFFYDRPLLFTEWGSDAYAQGVGPDEDAQADYIRGNWQDIDLNAAGRRGEGNLIGGVLFEWMDEWWKSAQGSQADSAFRQDVRGDAVFPYRDGWAHEEWYGIVSQGDGSNSPFLRQLRKAYFTLQELWRDADDNAKK